MSALVAVVFQFGAVYVPLTHVHVETHDSDHHHGREIHTHFSGHQSKSSQRVSPNGGHDDVQTVGTQLFAATTSEVFVAPIAILTMSDPVVAQSFTVRGAPEVAHGLDPPDCLTVSLRAPPSFLS